MESIRLENPWVYLLMPALYVFIWWDQKTPGDRLSAREEIRAIATRAPGLRLVTIAAGIKQIFMTLAAHLTGASLGREAVGIILGGWSARLRAANGWYFGACIAAGFAIVLGTPFAAAVFVFESKKWSLSWTDWLGVPLLAWLAYQFSIAVGVTHGDVISFAAVMTELQSVSVFKMLIFLSILITLATVLAALFQVSVDRITRFRSRHEGPTLRAALFPLLFLTLSGLAFWHFAERVEALGLPGLGIGVLKGLPLTEPEAFGALNHPILFGVIKVLLTAGFVGIGLRGGEFTPLLISGAMVSVGLGAILKIPIAGLLHLGLPLIWGIAARRPWAAGVIALELFGFGGWGILGPLIFVLVFLGIRLGDFAIGKALRSEVWTRGLYD